MPRITAASILGNTLANPQTKPDKSGRNSLVASERIERLCDDLFRVAEVPALDPRAELAGTLGGPLFKLRPCRRRDRPSARDPLVVALAFRDRRLEEFQSGAELAGGVAFDGDTAPAVDLFHDYDFHVSFTSGVDQLHQGRAQDVGDS